MRFLRWQIQSHRNRSATLTRWEDFYRKMLETIWLVANNNIVLLWIAAVLGATGIQP
jgi:sensor domain CHASE-containing protein